MTNKTTSSIDLVEELSIAARDLRAQRRFLKDGVESTTGFSFDALAHLYEKSADTITRLEEQLLEAQMRAHQWMQAHDKLKAGKPYEFPKPADLPDTITRLQAALEPFARIGGDILPSIPDDRHIFMAGIRGDRTATAGEYRRARAALRSSVGGE